jgi:hypothetical protein
LPLLEIEAAVEVTSGGEAVTSQLGLSIEK